MFQADLRPSRPGAADAADGGERRERAYSWDDPAVVAAAAREQDGIAFLKALLDGALPGAPIAHTLDFDPVSVEPGVVVFEFTPAEFHYNPIGTVHGGMIATVCDSACGCAVQSLLPAGSFYTSIDLSVKFLRPVTTATGPMTCEGTVTHLGGRSALAQARLTDADGKLYAHATSSCMIFRPPATS
ncbi:MAG TPA: PaaI family thioesterase [Streptosporangiaceae bacterium]|nr:PaaI family thioesterase [Streptosporangiaceae bacterium]